MQSSITTTSTQCEHKGRLDWEGFDQDTIDSALESYLAGGEADASELSLGTSVSEQDVTLWRPAHQRNS